MSPTDQRGQYWNGQAGIPSDHTDQPKQWDASSQTGMQDMHGTQGMGISQPGSGAQYGQYFGPAPGAYGSTAYSYGVGQHSGTDRNTHTANLGGYEAQGIPQNTGANA